MAIRPFHKVYPRAPRYGHPAVSQGMKTKNAGMTAAFFVLFHISEMFLKPLLFNIRLSTRQYCQRRT